MATIIITDTDNGIINKEFTYLLGFQPSIGGILIKKHSVFIFLDERYFGLTNSIEKNKIIEKIKKNNIIFKKIEGKIIDNILIECNNSSTLKLEETLNLKYFEEINQKSNMGIYLNPKKTQIVENYFNKSRITKNTEEISNIKKAIDIIENVFLEIEKLNNNRELIGKTEKDIRKIIIKSIIDFGGTGESFDSIVAFGKNSAIPHHQTGETLIGNGPLLIDMGAIYNGYCSDFTRTIWIGDKNEEYLLFEKIYNIVLNAHNKAKEKIMAGICTSELDKTARDYITEMGYGEYFTHNTGHGLGLNIHELPSVHKDSIEILKNGMVFTIEPGIYLTGSFGIRHENIFFI